MEHKQTEATITAVDEAQGIVEAIWAVMGNTDDTGDIIHPGAFTKTFNERGHQIKLLDNHRTDSVLSALGTVLELRELRRGELPQKLMENPDITGAAYGKFQFLMDTPEGAGAFKRIQRNAIHSWSFGYDAVDKDYTNKDGKTIRNLRGIKLYEVSPVLFPANSATTTTSAKAKPTEGKPYGVVEEDGKYCVYKLDADGKPTGERLGEHDTEAEAEAQRRALYANEEEDKAVTRSEGDGAHPAGHYLVVEDPEKPTTWHLRIRNAAGEVDHRLMGAAWAALHGGYRGNKYEGPGKEEAIAKLTRLYESEGMTPPGKSSDDPDELKAGRVLSARNAKRIKAAMDELHTCLMEAGLMEMMPDDEEANTGPHKAATPSTSDGSGSQPEQDGAGTDTDDSTRLKLIELELEELEV